ncbi:unnamed protein product, partial [Symbiodinium sp. KB8]
KELKRYQQGYNKTSTDVADLESQVEAATREYNDFLRQAAQDLAAQQQSLESESKARVWQAAEGTLLERLDMAGRMDNARKAALASCAIYHHNSVEL